MPTPSKECPPSRPPGPLPPPSWRATRPKQSRPLSASRTSRCASSSCAPSTCPGPPNEPKAFHPTRPSFPPPLAHGLLDDVCQRELAILSQLDTLLPHLAKVLVNHRAHRLAPVLEPLLAPQVAPLRRVVVIFQLQTRAPRKKLCNFLPHHAHRLDALDQPRRLLLVQRLAPRAHEHSLVSLA